MPNPASCPSFGAARGGPRQVTHATVGIGVHRRRVSRSGSHTRVHEHEHATPAALVSSPLDGLEPLLGNGPPG
ncbi:hypothetical protein Cch01nite_43590 [Cellulomonas chitinilytica]|uniref:Uncharacterized protein n=1 Tax=Cellulomonas chitinilytica TaxID=398759 RepID=A0A919P6I0_9CELL|nr:hypothetical protein Cch01nite_43590 [Cellulomonas chitinilytica]